LKDSEIYKNFDVIAEQRKLAKLREQRSKEQEEREKAEREREQISK